MSYADQSESLGDPDRLIDVETELQYAPYRRQYYAWLRQLGTAPLRWLQRVAQRRRDAGSR